MFGTFGLFSVQTSLNLPIFPNSRIRAVSLPHRRACRYVWLVLDVCACACDTSECRVRERRPRGRTWVCAVACGHPPYLCDRSQFCLVICRHCCTSTCHLSAMCAFAPCMRRMLRQQCPSMLVLIHVCCGVRGGCGVRGVCLSARDRTLTSLTSLRSARRPRRWGRRRRRRGNHSRACCARACACDVT